MKVQRKLTGSARPLGGSAASEGRAVLSPLSLTTRLRFVEEMLANASKYLLTNDPQYAVKLASRLAVLTQEDIQWPADSALNDDSNPGE